jgi:hypothetical protein
MKIEKRLDVINFLANKIDAQWYLEIGVHRGRTLHRVNVPNKYGVDPKPHGKMGRQNTTHLMTSDEFFEQNNQKFDIIFIDGLHLHEQVYKDINNSLKVLNDGGYIVCHDMNPPEERFQLRHRRTRRWNGDCWKAWVRLRMERDDLEMFVVNVDEGCGVISRGAQERLDAGRVLSYDGVGLGENKKEWLNLISAEDFLNKYE